MVPARRPLVQCLMTRCSTNQMSTRPDADIPSKDRALSYVDRWRAGRTTLAVRDGNRRAKGSDRVELAHVVNSFVCLKHDRSLWRHPRLKLGHEPSGGPRGHRATTVQFHFLNRPLYCWIVEVRFGAISGLNESGPNSDITPCPKSAMNGLTAATRDRWRWVLSQ